LYVLFIVSLAPQTRFFVIMKKTLFALTPLVLALSFSPIRALAGEPHTQGNAVVVESTSSQPNTPDVQSAMTHIETSYTVWGDSCPVSKAGFSARVDGLVVEAYMTVDCNTPASILEQFGKFMENLGFSPE
jgi:hypothetical protein